MRSIGMNIFPWIGKLLYFISFLLYLLDHRNKAFISTYRMEEVQSSSTKLIQQIQNRNPYSYSIKNKSDTETGTAKNVSSLHSGRSVFLKIFCV